MKASTKKHIATVLVVVILLFISSFIVIALRNDNVHNKIDNLFYTYLRAHAEQNISLAASVFYPEESEEYKQFIERADYFENPNLIFTYITHYYMTYPKVGLNTAKTDVSIRFYHDMPEITYHLSFIKKNRDWYFKHDIENMSHLYDFDGFDDNARKKFGFNGSYTIGDNENNLPAPVGAPLVIQDKNIAEYSVKIDDVINYDTFRDLTNLSRVIFPANYYHIDPQWFSSCPNLYSIKVSPDCNYYSSEDGVVYTKNKEALICYPMGKIQNQNSSLGVFVMPDTVQQVKDYAFFKTRGVKKVILSPNLKKIGSFAFSESVNLEEVIGNDLLEHIGVSAFENCEKLKSFVLPDTVTHIGKAAFLNCRSMASFTVSPHSKLKNLGHSVFQNCRALKTFYVPQGITGISHWMFLDCVSLEEVILHPEVAEIGLYAFKNCISLESLYIGQNITSVNRGAFYRCDALSLKVGFKSAPAGWHIAWDEGFYNTEWESGI